MNSYTGDQSARKRISRHLRRRPDSQNLKIGTDDQDMGYAAQFGYRFTRYFAAEFALRAIRRAAFLRARRHRSGQRLRPAQSVNHKFHAGGPNAVGHRHPADQRQVRDLWSRGVLFASSEREFVIKVDGDTVSFGTAKGESTEVALGLGIAWHVNQMFSVRAAVREARQGRRSGQDRHRGHQYRSLGLVVRF